MSNFSCIEPQVPPVVKKVGEQRVSKRSGGNNGTEAIDYGPLAGWVGFHLRMAQNASFQAFARRANGF